ncbi:MAG: VOC family protein [Ilumatobacteraceae bacterium]
MIESFPSLRAVVVDAPDARLLGEFYRQLLGYRYRDGDEPPADDRPDERGQDWLVLCDRGGVARVAIQQVTELAPSTWPDSSVPQQLHLDLTVADITQLTEQRGRALSLGAALVDDRSTDPEEPLVVFADPAGHPFCIFVSPDHPG